MNVIMLKLLSSCNGQVSTMTFNDYKALDSDYNDYRFKTLRFDQKHEKHSGDELRCLYVGVWMFIKFISVFTYISKN